MIVRSFGGGDPHVWKASQAPSGAVPADSIGGDQNVLSVILS